MLMVRGGMILKATSGKRSRGFPSSVPVIILVRTHICRIRREAASNMGIRSLDVVLRSRLGKGGKC